VCGVVWCVWCGVCVCVWRVCECGVCVCGALVRSKTPNQELHMQPHLATFQHNHTLLYCIVSF